MSTTELVKLSAAEMAAKIKAKEVSSRELVEAHLAVIESAEPSVKAFLKVSADQALEQADAFDAKSDEDKAQMFVDIMPEGPADDGIAYLNFYLEEDADTEAILKDVKEALEEGKISSIRYESYKELYEELKQKRRY